MQNMGAEFETALRALENDLHGVGIVLGQYEQASEVLLRLAELAADPASAAVVAQRFPELVPAFAAVWLEQLRGEPTVERIVWLVAALARLLPRYVATFP